jgi:hypothetical protein
LFLACACGYAADIEFLKEVIRPGMTNGLVEAIIAEHCFADCGSHLEAGELIRLQVSPLSYVLCTYGHAKDRRTSIGNSAELTAVEFTSFTDLARPVVSNQYYIETLDQTVSEDVWHCMCQIHQCPGMSAGRYNPVRFVQSLNILQAHGKPTVIAAMIHYRDLSSIYWYHSHNTLECATQICSENYLKYDLDVWRVSNVAQLLFKPERAGSEMSMYTEGRMKFEFVDDIPFNVEGFGGRTGPPFDPLPLIRFCAQKCAFRDGPIVPNGSPIEAVEQLCASNAFVDDVFDTYRLRMQALRCLNLPACQNVACANLFDYRSSPSCVGVEAAERFWQEYTAPLRQKLINWDAEAQEFRIEASPTNAPRVTAANQLPK